ncbi:MAG TPA: CapA family protein [Gaiellaceae bacterium]
MAALAVGLSRAFPARGDATAVAPATPGEHAAEPATSREAPAGTVTIAWGGDTVLGSLYGLPPDEGRPMLAHVAPLFRAADIGWVNLEEALSNASTSKCARATAGTCFSFGAPPSYARTLPASGIRIVNLANNHADDYGAAGQAATLAALRAAHVAWDGTPGEIEVLRVHGIRVAFLGFAPYTWASRLDDIPAAVRLVTRASKRADVVVVAIHAGAEGRTADHVPAGTEYFLGENRGNSRAFAHAVIDAGADLVVGSGPHVIRGVQWYHRRLIAYSLGNLAGWHTFGLGGTLSESAIITVSLRGDGTIRRGKWTPLLLQDPGVPVIDSGGRSLALVQQLSRADFGSSAARFTAAGALLVPHA